MIVAIVGPSGSGKSSLRKALECFYRAKAIGAVPHGYDENIVKAVEGMMWKDIKEIKDKFVVKEAISHTTRPRRSGEVNGIHYYFVEENDFLALSRYESTLYNGYYYGLTEESVEETLRFSEIALVVVDQHGVSNIKNKTPYVKSIFLKSDLKTMEARMLERGDRRENVQKRLNNAIVNQELEYPAADYAIDNRGELISALSQAIDIIEELRK